MHVCHSLPAHTHIQTEPCGWCEPAGIAGMPIDALPTLPGCACEIWSIARPASTQIKDSRAVSNEMQAGQAMHGACSGRVTPPGIVGR